VYCFFPLVLRQTAHNISYKLALLLDRTIHDPGFGADRQSASSVKSSSTQINPQAVEISAQSFTVHPSSLCTPSSLSSLVNSLPSIVV